MIVQVINIFSFWDVLLDQTIGIFVEAPRPRVIRVSEEPFSFQVVENLFMVSEISAIVMNQGKDAILIGFQVVTDRIRNSPRCLIDGLDRNAKSRFSITVLTSQSRTRLRRLTISGRLSMETLFLIWPRRSMLP